MNELHEALRTLRIIELHISEYEYRVDFYAPWEHSGSLTVTLVSATPQELTQAILRMTGGADNVQERPASPVRCNRSVLCN